MAVSSSDNGKQITDRFGKGGEALFDKLCRRNGIAHRLTAPRSPTTAGKIERFHQTMRRELLDQARLFVSLLEAQAAIDDWVREYNAARPHQALETKAPVTPAERFQPASAPSASIPDSGRPPAFSPLAATDAAVTVLMRLVLLSSWTWFRTHHGQRDRTGRGDRRPKFYELRDNLSHVNESGQLHAGCSNCLTADSRGAGQCAPRKLSQQAARRCWVSFRDQL
jgi:hypothetical protein